MTHLHHLVSGAGGHEKDLAVPPDASVHQAKKDDDAPVVVILAVEDQGLQGRIGIAGGRRDVRHDILQHGVDVDACLGGDLRGVLGGNADDLLDLILHPLGLRRGQVDLVHNGEDLQIVIQGQIGVGKGLGLHTLAGVHHQDGALAGGERTADLIVEVHMARGVDQIQGIAVPVPGLVGQAHGTGLDGDATLLFQIHVVQDLVFHDALLHGAALFDEPVGQGGLAMVDMGDDGKIADLILFDHDSSPSADCSALSARSKRARSSFKNCLASRRLTSPGCAERPSR